jgi:hypothetical protein
MFCAVRAAERCPTALDAGGIRKVVDRLSFLGFLLKVFVQDFPCVVVAALLTT